MQFIDLHTHTHASDGSDAPSDLVKKAAKQGLCAIAITDHDTIGGVAEAMAQGVESNIEVVRGCELSVKSDYGEIHILGLWIDANATELENGLEQLRKYRTDRNKIIIERLQGVGVDINHDEVLDRAGGDAVGRPHIAAVLLDKGYVSSIKEAFSSYLGSHGKAYEPKKIFSMQEAMHLLQSANASIALAHPGLIHCDNKELDKLVGFLKTLGLSAIEVYHSAHTRSVELACTALARKYGLDISGGSDYHGLTKPDIQLGFGKGNLRITLELLDRLKESRIKKGLAV